MIIDCIDEFCDIGVAWRIFTDERGMDAEKIVVYGVEACGEGFAVGAEVVVGAVHAFVSGS